MATYSIVFNIWRRSTDLLARSLYCWQNQTYPPFEIIVVDLNDDGVEVKKVGKVLYHFPLARHVTRPLSRYNFSRGQNIGIKATSPDADYVLCTGLELMFSANYLAELETIMSPTRLALGITGLLPEKVDIPAEPFSEWDRLVNSTEHTSKNQMSPGTLQCASRDWWFKIRGYDESIPYTFSDSDIIRRAWLDEPRLQPLCFGWDRAQVIHQWHLRPSFDNLPTRTLESIQRDMTVVRNPNGWGQ